MELYFITATLFILMGIREVSHYIQFKNLIEQNEKLQDRLQAKSYQEYKREQRNDSEVMKPVKEEEEPISYFDH
jgi:hypothetical protein